MFSKVLSELDKAREASEIAMGLRKSKSMEAAILAKQHKKERDEKKRLRRLAKLNKNGGSDGEHQDGDDAANEATQEEMERRLAEKLLDDERKALELIARTAEREKAWFMAHPHKFIRHPGEPAFCIVCKEKENEYWMKVHRETEQQWRHGFDALLMEIVESQEPSTRATVECDLKDALTRRAQEVVATEIAAEEAQALEDSNPLRKLGKSMKGSMKSFSPLKLLNAAKSGMGGGGLFGGGAAAAATAAAADDDDEEAWPRELHRISSLLRAAGLSLVDARGKSILPKRPPKKAVVQTFVAPVLVDEEGGADDGEDRVVEMGLRIRVWHRDADGARANFLGYLNFSEKVRYVVLFFYNFVVVCSAHVANYDKSSTSKTICLIYANSFIFPLLFFLFCRSAGNAESPQGHAYVPLKARPGSGRA